MTTYTTKGSVRGSCGHKHRTITAAAKCCCKDQRQCKSVGGYSDRTMVKVGDEPAVEQEYEYFLDQCKLYK